MGTRWVNKGACRHAGGEIPDKEQHTSPGKRVDQLELHTEKTNYTVEEKIGYDLQLLLHPAQHIYILSETSFLGEK